MLHSIQPKTRGIAIVNTFHWSESNRFSVPRISKEEQLVVAAKNLTSALKDGPLPCIPDQNLKSKIDLLCDIFKEASENIITTKLSPIQKESTEELSSIGAPKPSTIKQMIEKNDQHPRVEESKLQPRAEESELYPRVAKTKLSTKEGSDLIKDKLEPSYMAQPMPKATHRYPTRSAIAKAANSAQLEQKQLDSPSPVTHQFIIDIVNPPNLLKYKQLIKSKDKAVWQSGMCNELGRLSQGFKSIKGKNTIFFIRKNKIPKSKRVTYARIVCATRPQKTETHRVRLTAGGNLIYTPA